MHVKKKNLEECIKYLKRETSGTGQKLSTIYGIRRKCHGCEKNDFQGEGPMLTKWYKAAEDAVKALKPLLEGGIQPLDKYPELKKAVDELAGIAFQWEPVLRAR